MDETKEELEESREALKSIRTQLESIKNRKEFPSIEYILTALSWAVATLDHLVTSGEMYNEMMFLTLSNHEDQQ